MDIAAAAANRARDLHPVVLAVAATAAVAAALLLLHALVLGPALLSPLARIPAAHWHCHVAPLWLYWLRWAGRENRTVHALHARLGPIVRTAPNELSVNCYDGGLRTIYAGGFHKTDFYHNRFANYGVDPMFALSGRAHAERRRMLAHVYAKSYVWASPTARATTRAVLFDRLLPIIDAATAAGEPLEVLRLLSSYALDAFTSYQFGLAGGTNLLQDAAVRRWYMRAFYGGRPYLFWTTQLPALAAWLQRLDVGLGGLGLGLGRLLRLMPRWAEQATREIEAWQLALCDAAEQRLAAAAAGDPSTEIPAVDYPVVFSQARQAVLEHKGPSEASRLLIASEMMDHSVAAHETSGDTLTYLFWELSRRPALQDALRAELRSLDVPMLYGTTATDTQEMPDPKAVDQLPLLDAVLQETLRLHAAVPGGQPRVTPWPSCSLAGYDNIPGGVRVQSQAFTLHRNADVFPDPETWRPERWIDQSPEQLALMRRWFWAWGSGGAMCIGRNFAVQAIKYATAAVYTNYRSVIVDAPDMVQAEGFTAGPRGGKLDLQFQRVA